MVETKTIKGLVQEKTENSLKISNYWIRFFDTGLIENFNVNDNVEVVYVENKKDGKIYRNGKGCTLIQVSKVNIVIPDTTVNTLLMCIKDIVISTDKPIETITKELLNSYKIIIS